MVGSHDDGYAAHERCAARFNIPTARIRALNDAFRTGRGSGRLAITSGVRALGAHKLASVLNQVRCYDNFGDTNDPYLEHDFGSIDIEDVQVFWKIDYFDENYENGSSDPADANVTGRLMTIMLASEY